MNKPELAEYALFLHALADQADEIARHYYGQPIPRELKADNSPVTIADKEIEMALVQQIRTHYPEHGIYGEETARVNEQADWQWVIDPIDGTKAFIAKKPTFVTLIALCYQEKPVLGIISQPIQKKRWLGGDGQANQAKLIDSLEDAQIATTSISYFSSEESIFFQKLEKKTSSTVLNIDGFAAGMIADGDLDILIESKLKPYDFCALAPVIEQAGGVMTNWNGEPITMNSDGRILAAANKTLHKAALDLLNAR